MPFINRTIIHILASLLLSIVFFLPDILFKLHESHYFFLNLKLYKEYLGFFVLNLILLSIVNYKIKYVFYVLFLTFSLVELLHYSFFHSLIMPYEIPMLFNQSSEMLDTVKGIWGYIVIYPIVIYIVTLAIIYIFLHKIDNFVIKIKILPIFLSIIILIVGTIIASQRTSPYLFLPKAESTSIKNMYNVLSWTFSKEIPKLITGNKNNIAKFSPYIIEPMKHEKPQTIIVVMGESLGAKYMSLFDFNITTTPKLDKRKIDLEFTWGYSGGINTDVSVPTFFLLKREPQNNLILLKEESNLFALAKKSGYITHYITTQKLTVLGGFLGNNVDVTLSKKDLQKGNKNYDSSLVDYLKTIDFSKKNFIVLHQRNSHSPYAKQTPKEFYKFDFKGKPYKEYMRNSYFNSLLYTDTLYDEIIHIIEKEKKAGIVFFTSDHSEMLGYPDEGGKYGHTYLGFEDTKVPMMVYKNEAMKKYPDLVHLKNIISHYQFGLSIARTIGYNIINPNENGTYFINGVDISGNQGYLKYQKKDKLYKSLK